MSRPPLPAPPNVGPLPLVTVFIAAYNCAAYIAVAIESALAQRYVDVEVIVVDDASSDDTAIVARRYEDGSRVSVLVNEQNRGPSYSRNLAMAHARGDWLAQLDGDDWMADDRLAELVRIALARDADIVIDNCLLVDDATLRPISTRFVDNGVPWRTLHEASATDLIRYDLGSCKPLLRRNFLQRHRLAYPEDIKYGEDFLLLLRALLCDGRMIVDPAPRYRLRRNNVGSLTSHRDRLLTQVGDSTRALMAEPDIAARPELLDALRSRLQYVQHLIETEHFRQLAGAHLGQAGLVLLRQPRLALTLASRIAAMMTLRLRRMILARSHIQIPTLLRNSDVHTLPKA
jgi:succinoglycan biosynthesis protein ExoO